MVSQTTAFKMETEFMTIALMTLRLANSFILDYETQSPTWSVVPLGL